MTDVALRDHLIALMDERDCRVRVELRSQEKAVAIAFEASKEAVNKAERAQSDYNKFHNELQRKMDDERQQFVPRKEYDLILARTNVLEREAAAGSGKMAGVTATVAILVSLLGMAIAVYGIASR